VLAVIGGRERNIHGPRFAYSETGGTSDSVGRGGRMPMARSSASPTAQSSRSDVSSSGGSGGSRVRCDTNPSYGYGQVAESKLRRGIRAVALIVLGIPEQNVAGLNYIGPLTPAGYTGPCGAGTVLARRSVADRQTAMGHTAGYSAGVPGSGAGSPPVSSRGY